MKVTYRTGYEIRYAVIGDYTIKHIDGQYYIVSSDISCVINLASIISIAD